MDCLELFQGTITQRQIEREYTTEHRPITLLDNATSIQFEVSLSENELIKFNDSSLYMKLQVKGFKDGKAVAELGSTLPTNYLLNSLFKQVTLAVNGAPINEPMPNFMYKAYIEAKLAYSKDAKKSHLTSALWFGDDSKAVEHLNEGRPFEIMGRLHLDLSHQPKAFPGPCNLMIKLDLNPPSFMFTTDLSEISMKFIDVSFMAEKIALTNDALKAFKSQRIKKPIRMPYTSSFVRAIPISANTIDTCLEDVCRGKIPKRIYLGFVKNSAYNGSYKAAPFVFENFGVNYLVCNVDGLQYPSIVYRPDFKAGLCAREYCGLVKCLGQDNTDSYAKMSYYDFLASPIFGFPLTPNLDGADCVGGMINAPREGIIRIQLRFQEALKLAITAIVYLEFDSALVIDSAGNYNFQR